DHAARWHKFGSHAPSLPAPPPAVHRPEHPRADARVVHAESEPSTGAADRRLRRLAARPRDVARLLIRTEARLLVEAMRARVLPPGHEHDLVTFGFPRAAQRLLEHGGTQAPPAVL